MLCRRRKTSHVAESPPEEHPSIPFCVNCQDLHLVVLEELLELPLSSRIGKVPNVQPTSLIGTGGSSVGGLLLLLLVLGRSSTVGSLVGSVGGNLVGDGFDGRRHLDG